jgi:hypothetical protein
MFLITSSIPSAEKKAGENMGGWIFYDRCFMAFVQPKIKSNGIV